MNHAAWVNTKADGVVAMGRPTFDQAWAWLEAEGKRDGVHITWVLQACFKASCMLSDVAESTPTQATPTNGETP